ncbi:MAG TPA: hypothetical protein PKC91_12425 [Ignavibacteria bacterium]|nr:hypothetical protein [Ignavibacteria bacterium]
MHDSRLIQTLRSFTKDEFRQFEKFAASPFFNNGRNYIPFLNELKKHHPDFENRNDSLKPDSIYKKIYPGKNFNKQVMWNLVSQLEKLAMEFILQTALKNNRRIRFVLMFDELSKRNLDKHIFKETESAEKYVSSLKYGIDYFNTKWVLENNKAGYWNSVQGRQDKSYEGTVKSTEYLLLSFLAELSIQVSDLKILNIMYNTGEELNSAIEFVKSLDFKKLVEAVKKNKNKYAAVINFYYNKIMCTIDENEESYFFEMKKYFDANYKLFDAEEQSNTVISLANYCAHKMRLGEKKYLKILFEINKFRLEKEIGAYQNGRINKALYHQIIRNALSLGEIKWAERFVSEYTSKLKREHQKTMNALAMGYICYAKKNYSESLEFLNKVEFIDIRDKLHVRILSAKAYFELNKSELLYYYIDSSKHFIGNNALIENTTKEAYMKFFNYLKRLLTLKETPDKFRLKELKADLELDKVLRLRHKRWLMGKIVS